MRPDHGIIGSGTNAQVSGALRALKGGRVLFLEREAVPGSCPRDDKITLPGLRHGVMAAMRLGATRTGASNHPESGPGSGSCPIAAQRLRA